MIVGILGPGGCGGTFLDWSLHYLNGDITHWVAGHEIGHRNKVSHLTEQNLVKNPLRGSSAHAHVTTHPDNESLIDVLDISKTLPKDNLHTFYYVDSMFKMQKSTTHNNIVNDNKNVLFLTYNFSKSDTDKIFCFQYEKFPITIINREYLKVIQSNNEWEKRELLSLYYPECIKGQIVETKIPQPNNFLIEFDEFLNSGSNVIEHIFNFLNLKLDEERFAHWKTIYQKWKQGNNLSFFQDLDMIIESILQNKNVDLTKYNMTFAKEVVIASNLMYQHNKSLKAYGIDQIALNTADWHTLLEENIYHNLVQTNW